MAGALVGGAFLSATLQVLFDRMASRQVLDFFKGQELDAGLLKKLKTTMLTVNKVLDDAEDKQHTDPNVRQWLDELKDVVYEAEDFLDEIASQVQRSKIEAESQTPFENVQDFASSSSHFGSGKKEKLEEILKTLEDLINQKNALGLIDGAGEKSSFQRSPTTSIPDESVTYGRDADKKAIMEWLLSDGANDTNPDVLAIVGMGGLGKTTLAQVVYGDSRADDYFDQKAWVYVSEEFNVSKVTKDILQEFSKKSSYADSLNQLQNQLKEDLKEKKFLLILDDVWNKQYSEWDQLLKPLRFGEKGSKILVTTRDKKVAQIVQTCPAYRPGYQLEKLSKENCWLLFQKHAFIGRNSSPALLELKRIGRQIIEKCDGLPLATKVLGGALRSEEDPREWMKILKSDTWNVWNDNIIPVLKLSYRFLSSVRKRCFAYCAVFPKGYEFKKEQLIHLWMAEGLLSLPKGNMEIEELEETAEDCFNDLVSRSFLKKSIKEESFLKKSIEEECFLMHDLINDLANSISGEFCFRFGVDKSCELVERVRHLWFDYKIGHKEVNNWMLPTQHLRTFLYVGWWWPRNVDAVEVQNSLLTSTTLRVLCFPPSQMIELPDSIGNLILLRYLDLSGSSIKRLPDSVGSLCNLETLILYQCYSLVELPATTFKLINLCQLDIRGTKLRNMPPRMGTLRKLGELAYFIVGKECDYSIKQLGELKRLRGCLRIEKLENILQVEESTAANLKSKEKLNELEFVWGDEGSEDSLHVRNVLEQLQPHTNIERLSIYGYAGTRFPDWVGDSAFSNMVKLKLERCRYCSSLPPLGQLGSLERLSVVELDGITVVGHEFYGNGNKPPFGCLKYLRFERMAQWEEWVSYSNMDEGGGSLTSFPLLESLVIEECPNLKIIQPTRLPSLTDLEIKGCDLPASFPRAPEIRQFLIKDGSREMKLCKLPSSSELPSLGVYFWRQSADSPLELAKQMLESPNFIGLKEVYVRNYDSLTRFPVELFPTLEYLEIEYCPILESLSLAAASQEEKPLQCFKFLTLNNCPKLKWLSGCIVPSLMELEICHCPSVAIVDWLRLFPNLTKLRCEEVESFLPENMFLPSTLTSLEIWGFPNLKSLDNEGLQSLTSLTKLRISNCPNLVSLLNMSLQSLIPLRELEISSCSNLREVWLPPTLTSLTLQWLENLESLDNWGFLTSLTQWEIRDCPKLPSLPREGPPSSLTSLTLHNLENLESLDNWGLHRLTSLIQLNIFDCRKLQSLGKEGLPSSLTSLRLRNLENLESLDNWGLHRLTSLIQLNIFNCPKLQTLGKEGLPSSLTSLRLYNLENLESLDNWGLHRLTSLIELNIFSCPKLQTLGKEGPPSSLQRVDIFACPLLELGEDWPFNPPRA